MVNTNNLEIKNAKSELVSPEKRRREINKKDLLGIEGN